MAKDVEVLTAEKRAFELKNKASFALAETKQKRMLLNVLLCWGGRVSYAEGFGIPFGILPQVKSFAKATEINLL